MSLDDLPPPIRTPVGPGFLNADDFARYCKRAGAETSHINSRLASFAARIARLEQELAAAKAADPKPTTTTP